MVSYEIKELLEKVKELAWKYYNGHTDFATEGLIKILTVLGEYPKKVG